MKLKSTANKCYAVHDQLIGYAPTTRAGEWIGSFIQPAQSKDLLTHLGEIDVATLLRKKLESLMVKLRKQPASVLVNKWQQKFDFYQTCCALELFSFSFSLSHSPSLSFLFPKMVS